MPTLRRTPFNQGGSYVSDPMDHIEEGNRAAGFQFMGMRQNDMMAQLAMQKLNNENFQYRQNRSDNLGMFQEKLKHDDHVTDVNAGLQREGWTHDDARFGKQFDYMAGRDTRADAQHQQEWDFEHDKDRNPSLQAALQANVVNQKLAELMQRRSDRDERAEIRTDKAADAPVDTTGWSKEDLAANQARIASGQAPAAAGYATSQDRAKRGRDEVEGQETALGADLAHFSEKDNAWGFGTDASDEDRSGLAARLAKLEESLRMKFDLSQGAAHDRANQLINKNTRHSMNSGQVDALRRQRLLPE